MGTIKLGPLKHLVILGSCGFSAAIEEFAKKHGICVSFVTSPSQKDEFSVCQGENVKVFERLNPSELENFLMRTNIPMQETVALSFGARWIFKKEVIDGVFLGRLLNLHGSRLPYDRGAGGFSWRIMRGDRLGQVLIHQVDEGIDTGPIVYSKNYIVPSHCKIPADFINDYEFRVQNELFLFLESLLLKEELINCRELDLGLGTYFPRLTTDIHGWVNWQMSPIDIVNFINAFDDPYPGAQTMCKGQIVRLKKVQLHGGEPGFHPFQAGLVVRKEEAWITVALSGQYSLLVTDMSTLGEVREGDRLYTPQSYLDQAFLQRTVYTPLGRRD